jgi:hypothetical protein
MKNALVLFSNILRQSMHSLETVLKKESIYSFIRSKLIPFVVDYWYGYIFLFLKFNCV